MKTYFFALLVVILTYIIKNAKLYLRRYLEILKNKHTYNIYNKSQLKFLLKQKYINIRCFKKWNIEYI